MTVTDAPEETRSSTATSWTAAARAAVAPAEVVPVLALWAPMLLWFLAMKPGIMTNDSVDVWRQIQTGQWIDWHPVVYTAVQWVSYQLVSSPVLVTLGQSLALAWAIARILKIGVRLGLPAVPVWIVASLVALTPPIGAFSVHLWKDVPYTVAFLFVAELFLRQVLARLEMAPAPRRASWVLAGTGLALLVLLRPNGIVVVLLTGVAIVVVARRRWVAAGVWAAALVAAFAVQAVLPALVGAEPPAGRLEGGLAPFALGHLLTSHPDALDDDDMALVERLAPVEDWEEKFNCHWNGVPMDELAPGDEVAEISEELQASWRSLLIRHPIELGTGHLCAASVAWNPIPSERERVRFETLYYGVIDNDIGLHTAPVSQRLNDVAVDVLQSTATPAGAGWQPWFWRAPTWIYLCAVLVVATSILRRVGWPVFALAPLVAQQVSVIAMTGAHARYMLPAGIAAVALAPVLAKMVQISVRERRVVAATADDV